MIAAWLSAAHAQPDELASPEARAHFERAVKLWQAGDYAGADAELAAAAAIEPTPALQYARGQLARELGDCERALSLYREFLPHTEPGTRAREEVLMNIARCEATMPTAEPEPAPAVVDAPPAEPSPPDRPVRRVDPAAVGLLASGSVLTAAAVGLGIAAGIERRAAGTSDVLEDFERHRRRSRIELGTAGAAGSVGVALLVAGIVRLVDHRRRARIGRRPGPAGVIRF